MTRRTSRGVTWLTRWLVAMFMALGVPAQANADAARDVMVVSGDEPSFRAPAIDAHAIVVHRGALEISYPPAIDAQVQNALAHVDGDVRVLTAQLGLDEVPPLDIRLVANPDAMRLAAPPGLPPPAYAVGVAYPGLGLAIVSASAPRSWEASDMRRVLRHELSHLLLGIATNEAPIPRWLSEGVAVYQAGEHDFERFKALALASFTGGVVSLRRLDGSFAQGPDQVNVAYAESADFVSYLLRANGPGRFMVLVAHLREGLSLEEATQQTYRSSLAQIEYDWRHDMQVRFLTAPLWAGTGFLWLIGVPLMLIAFVRRRRASRATVARWEREERAAAELALAHQHHAVVMVPSATTVSSNGGGVDDSSHTLN